MTTPSSTLGTSPIQPRPREQRSSKTRFRIQSLLLLLVELERKTLSKEELCLSTANYESWNPRIDVTRARMKYKNVSNYPRVAVDTQNKQNRHFKAVLSKIDGICRSG